MKSWYTIRARSSGAEVLIYDEIGAYGVSAKGFLAELGALPAGAPIDLRLNSPGGSVFDAVAIYNALTRHSGQITVWIDGIAASAASYIAMAGDEIVMPENAFLMIHDPAGLVMGTAEDMRAMAGALDKVKGSLVQGYAARSGKPEEQIAALMTAETWFDAKDALDLGLATRIAEPVRMAASFDIARFRNAPPALAEMGDAQTVGDPNGIGESDAEGAETADDIVPDQNDVAPIMQPESHTVSPQTDVDDSNIPPIAEPASNVAASSIAPDPGAIRAEAMAHARAVVDLCRLAGLPQMAGRFLETDVALEDVRAALLAARADATPDIAGHHAQPGRPAATRPWGEIVARTFKLKGSQP